MLKVFSLALLALLMFSGCSDTQKKSDSSSDALIAKTVYQLKGIDGTPYTVSKSGSRFTLEGVQEPVVIYDIFATWCPPCRAAMPHLESLQRKFAGKIKLLGVTIETDQSDAYFKRFAQDHGVTYTLINAPDNQPLTRAMGAAIGIGQDFPIPLMVVYKNGQYVKHYSGLVPEEMLESDIKQFIKAQ